MSPPRSGPLPLLLLLGLADATGCRPSAVAPVTAPATGSDWVQAPSATAATPGPATPEPAAAPPSRALLHAAEVDGTHDDRITGDRIRAEYEPSEPWLGADDPLVTIVAYVDYQCPYSRKLVPTLYELASLRSDVRVVFKHFPLPMHRDARYAAIAATAAHRQGRFWAVHDLLFDNSRALDRESVLGYAGRLGLDLELFRSTVDDPELAARIDADIKLAQGLGIRATPTMAINGRVVSGARTLPELLTETETEAALARTLLEAGAARSQLYAHYMHAARAEPAPTLAPTRSTAIADEVRREIDTTGLPRRGPKDAPVVIVECSDFDCPFCGRVGPTLDQLLDEHPKDVALVYRHLPLAFHQGAEPAARAAVAAQAQGKFWKMHDLLFANPKQRSEQQLEKLAKRAGLNVEKFRKVFRSPSAKARVGAEIEACQADGASGTPTFFINGRKLVGARPLADFEAVIAEELQGAK
ncbi:MAG: thioredoxin domain-containing protein [Nannocystaceae bacterium]